MNAEVLTKPSLTTSARILAGWFNSWSDSVGTVEWAYGWFHTAGVWLVPFLGSTLQAETIGLLPSCWVGLGGGGEDRLVADTWIVVWEATLLLGLGVCLFA